MANVTLHIAGRSYDLACADGEEAQLERLADMVDGYTRKALKMLGSATESRQFLFAALLMADDLEQNGQSIASTKSAAQSEAPIAPGALARLSALADAAEQLADLFEQSQAKSSKKIEALEPSPV